MPTPVVNLKDKLAQIDEQWTPRIAGELNGQQVKLVKLAGDFVWHRHEDEDELFLVLRGRMGIEFRDGTVEIEEGEFTIVPRGIEHKPFAEEECHVLLLEPAGTLNTGDQRDARTVENPKRI